MEMDVLIVGGGVIGLGIARELHRRGIKRITVIEKGKCGEEASWAAAGMLGPQADTEEGGDMLDLCIASRDLYPDLATALLDETGVDVELDRTGTLFLAFDDEDAERLKRRYTWQKAAGLRARRLTGAEARSLEPFISPDVTGGVLFPDDWQVDNRKLCHALRRYAEINWFDVEEHTEAVELISEHGRVAGVRTAKHDFRASRTIIATGAWTSLIKLGAFPLPLSIKPVRGQIICYRTAKRLFEHVVYSRDGYLVPRADGRVLVGSTSEDVGFVKGNPPEGVERLTNAAETIAPALIGQRIADRWSGLRPQSLDGLPILGAMPGLDDLFVATGHYRNGILLTPKTAEIIADAVVDGHSSVNAAVFGPDRFRVANARG